MVEDNGDNKMKLAAILAKKNKDSVVEVAASSPEELKATGVAKALKDFESTESKCTVIMKNYAKPEIVFEGPWNGIAIKGMLKAIKVEYGRNKRTLIGKNLTDGKGDGDV